MIFLFTMREYIIYAAYSAKLKTGIVSVKLYQSEAGMHISIYVPKILLLVHTNAMENGHF